MADATKADGIGLKGPDKQNPIADQKDQHDVTMTITTVITDGDDNKDDNKDVDIYSDDFKEIPPIFQATCFIKFQWDKKVENIYQCDTKQLLLMTWHGLQLTRERTIQKNIEFIFKKAMDRIQTYQDNPQVMTKLIDWVYADPVNNKFDGSILQAMHKSEFIQKYFVDIAGLKIGWAIKVYHYMTEDVSTGAIADDKNNWKLPNYKYNRRELADLNVNEIIIIIKEALPKFPTLVPYHDELIECIENKQLTGAKIIHLESKEFASLLDKKFGFKTKTKGPLAKLLRLLKRTEYK